MSNGYHEETQLFEAVLIRYLFPPVVLKVSIYFDLYVILFVSIYNNPFVTCYQGQSISYIPVIECQY